MDIEFNIKLDGSVEMLKYKFKTEEYHYRLIKKHDISCQVHVQQYQRDSEYNLYLKH